jgi:hypothetical protein
LYYIESTNKKGRFVVRNGIPNYKWIAWAHGHWLARLLGQKQKPVWSWNRNWFSDNEVTHYCTRFTPDHLSSTSAARCHTTTNLNKFLAYKSFGVLICLSYWTSVQNELNQSSRNSPSSDKVVGYLLPRYVMLPTGETTTAVPVQKTSSASSSSSAETSRSST